jgi:hypothetical protein
MLAMLWIAVLGGWLIMMGQQDRSEALFYYFRLEDQVPENHLLRLIEKHISFAFVREKLKESYSDTGRPSIDSELLLRILLIGYLYGITSERKLVEELRMHLAWRWFTLRSRAFYLSSRKQQLSLSGWRTAQLCGPECSQPGSRLYRQRQALWGMFAKGAMHKWAV